MMVLLRLMNIAVGCAWRKRHISHGKPAAQTVSPGSPSPTSVTTAAATPQTERQELPYRHQNDRADQRSENEDPKDVDITNSIDDDFCQHPGTNKRCDDGTNEAEGKPPANKRFRIKADDRRHDQVNDKVETKRPDIVTKFNGDAIYQNELAFCLSFGLLGLGRKAMRYFKSTYRAL
jgi:hypothetical protein